MKEYYNISIPKDENGFIHRRCPSCEYEFGVKAAEFPNSLHCPYCSEKTDIKNFNTSEQLEYARKEGERQIFTELQKEFQNMMKDAVKDSDNLSFNPGRISKGCTPHPTQANIPNFITCDKCDQGEYEVFGISGFCPFCGEETIKILEANLSVLENELGTDRGLRHLYGDIVITFQNECRIYVVKPTKTNFQNIKNARRYFKRHFGLDITENLTDDEKLTLKRIFEKRHCDEHNSGIISDRYVKEIPQDKDLLNQEVTRSKEEATEAVEILKKISSKLRKLSKGKNES